MKIVHLHMPRKVAPRGFPTCFRCAAGSTDGAEPSASVRDVLRRKSCVIAMPILAKDKEVLSHARNVLSVRSQSRMICTPYHIPNAR